MFDFQTLTNAQIASVHNLLVPADAAVKRFPSKGKAIEAVLALGIEITAVEFGADGVPLVSVNDDEPTGEPADLPVDEPTEGDEPAEEAAPFVKLAKEELPANGTPERAAYRKARRAAARAARKAKAA